MHTAALRYVAEVARRGSVRKAAAALNVAASAIDRQLLKVEASLGVALFDRLPGGMRPTPAGTILLRHVADTLLDFERVRAELDDLRGVKTGHVSIAAVDSLWSSSCRAASIGSAPIFPPSASPSTPSNRRRSRGASPPARSIWASPSSVRRRPGRPGSPRSRRRLAWSCRPRIRWRGGAACGSTTCAANRSSCPPDRCRG